MTNPYERLLVLLIASPLGICTLHAIISRIIFRIRPNWGAPQIIALGTIFVGNLPILWLAWDLTLKRVCVGAIDSACGVVYVLLTYNALGFWYFNILNLSETSLHVHILMELLIEGTIPSKQLATRYSAKEMVNTRIERMIALGQLAEQGERYVLSGNDVLLTVGKMIHTWRRILGLPLQPE
jgi:hypothetical protein